MLKNRYSPPQSLTNRTFRTWISLRAVRKRHDSRTLDAMRFASSCQEVLECPRTC